MATTVEGLYAHVRRNDRRSMLLFAGFLLAFQLLAAIALFLPLTFFDERHAPIYAWGGYALRYMPLVTIAAAALFVVQMVWHTHFLRRALNFHYVDSNDEPRLCRILEPLAIAAGVATPFVGVIETPARNAFACGVRRDRASVVVTRGLIDGLSDDELAGVIAHELMHVRAGDTRLMAAANIFLHNLELVGRRNPMRVYDWRTAFLIAILPVFLPLILVCGLLTQLAFRVGHATRTLIASSREFIADAEAVRLTQNPAALISALRRVEGVSTIDSLSASEEAMMIDGDSSGPLATHPAIGERIAAIVRTTGPAALIGAAPRDTRPAAFTRPERAALIAEPMALPVADQPLPRRFGRLIATRSDPERNLLGLSRKDMLIVAVGMAGIFGWNSMIYRENTLALFDIRPLKVLAQTAIVLEKCQLGLAGPDVCNPRMFNHPWKGKNDVGGLVGAMAKAGDKAAIDKSMYEYPDGTFSNVVPAPMAAARIRRDRCFQRESYTVGDRGLRPMSELPSLDGPSIPAMRGRAAASAASVGVASPNVRDEALKDYVATRGQLIMVAHRFFGEPGLAAMQSHYANENHAAVVAEIAQRMSDPRFVRGLNPVQRAEFELLGSAPDQFITCTAKRPKGARNETLVDEG